MTHTDCSYNLAGRLRHRPIRWAGGQSQCDEKHLEHRSNPNSRVQSVTGKRSRARLRLDIPAPDRLVNRCIPLLIFWRRAVRMDAYVRETGVVETCSQGRSTLRPICLALTLWVIAPGVAGPAVGQQTPPRRDTESFVNQQRAVEERLRRQFDAEVGESVRALFDWGGWYSLHLFVFDDGVESSRTLRRHDLRLWTRLGIDDRAHEFYARTRLSLLDFNSGDAYDGNDDDVEGPNLERGYYRFDLASTIRAYQGRRTDYNVVVTAGRDLVLLGTGLALATPLDHVSLRGTYRSWEFTGFAGRTVGSSEDFDLSRTVRCTRRDFLGAQVKYLGFERHEPFVYAFQQRDRNGEATFQPFQRFDYDSSYVGIGSTGEIGKGLRYTTEWVYESGRSFGHRQFIHDNAIDAWAVQAQLEYLFLGKRRARASVEYLFGSGDPDRLVSPTNTVGSNYGDRSDTGFIGFGYSDTGLSFAPRYGNLHMWRAGASYYPWPDNSRLKRFELGTDWYLYYKHHRAAAVSDPTADRQSGYLGCEMDYYANWRMTSDLACTARLGVFFPGRAFSDREVRSFFLVGMTWSF